MATDNALWDYALEHYTRDGVRELCLSLQDDAGVDVAFLFACGFLRELGATRAQLRQALADALTTTHELRADVLVPVRAARRKLKTLSCAPDAEAVRDQIKRAELAIERLCFDQIAALLPEGAAERAEKVSLRDAVGIYAELAGIRFDSRAEASLAALCARLG